MARTKKVKMDVGAEIKREAGIVGRKVSKAVKQVASAIGLTGGPTRAKRSAGKKTTKTAKRATATKRGAAKRASTAVKKTATGLKRGARKAAKKVEGMVTKAKRSVSTRKAAAKRGARKTSAKRSGSKR